MNRKSLTVGGVIVLMLAVAAPFVYAQQAHRGHGMSEMGMHGMAGPFGRLQKLQTALDLSDAQVTEIKAIFTDLRQQNAPYRAQVKGNLKTITSALLKDPNDIASAQSILDQQIQAEQAMKSNVLKAVSDALKVLTPDQRAKLGDLIAQRQAHWAARTGR